MQSLTFGNVLFRLSLYVISLIVCAYSIVWVVFFIVSNVSRRIYFSSTVAGMVVIINIIIIINIKVSALRQALEQASKDKNILRELLTKEKEQSDLQLAEEKYRNQIETETVG